MYDCATPLCEFDEDPADLLSYLVEGEFPAECPEVLVVTLLRPYAGEWLESHRSEVIASLATAGGVYPVHRVEVDGATIAVMPGPLGAPAITQLVDMAVQRGAQTVLAVGSCGGLHPNVEGEFSIVRRALRDEGTSHHYQAPDRWIELDKRPREALVQAARRLGYPHTMANTWTTDGILRETPGKVARRRDEGCDTVEMECAALAAMCRFRGAEFGQLLFTADTLVGDDHEARGWGVAAHEAALAITIRAAVALGCGD